MSPASPWRPDRPRPHAPPRKASARPAGRCQLHAPMSAANRQRRRRGRRRVLGVVLAAATLALAGCIDFLDPRLPQPGPALLQLFIHVLGNGTVQLEGTLLPGMSIAHEWRKVPNDSLMVEGQPVAPRDVHSNGGRDYSATVPMPGAVGPVTVVPPAVAGIPDRPPELRWYGIRRLDPDTIVLDPGADLHLHVDPSTPPQTPVPATRQWVLQLFSSGHTFQLGADGLPPADLWVPAAFLPGDSTAEIVASLLVLQGGVTNAAGGDYVLNASMDQHLAWRILRVRKGGT